MPDTFIKDSAAELDYLFDWKALTNGRGISDWLEEDETISSAVITPDEGITVESDQVTDNDTSVTVWLSGGTPGQSYKVVAAIVTSAGRSDKRTAKIRVRER